MRKQKGITLIALIITIIVMLILVGVTVNVAINGGLIDVARESKFKTQVMQIQEQVQIKKTIVQASDITNSQIIYNIQLSDLDIEQKLKNEFVEKLFVDEYGDLCYNKENVTVQEEEWLIELGIGTGADFVTDVTAFAARNLDEEYGYDYYTIYNDIKAKYPTTAILSNNPTSGTITPGIFVYANAEAMYYIKQTLDMVKEEYQNPESVTITSSIETEIRESLGEINIYNANSFFNDSTTISDIITKMEDKLEEEANAENSYVVINGENQLLISSTGVSEYTPKYEEIIIMTENEASEKFDYTYIEEDYAPGGIELGKIRSGEILAYKANEKTIKIPGVIIKNNGEEILIGQIQANALATTKPVKVNAITNVLEPLVLQPNLGKSYSQVTIAELTAIVSSFGVTPGTETYEETIEGKNEFTIKYILPIFCESGKTANECIEIIGEGEEQQLYGYVTFDSTETPTFYAIPTDSNGYVESRDKVVISEGILGIGDSILSGDIVVDLYLPKTLTASDTSITALSGATITNIRTRLTYDEIIEINDTGYAAEDVLGSGFFASDIAYITD